MWGCKYCFNAFNAANYFSLSSPNSVRWAFRSLLLSGAGSSAKFGMNRCITLQSTKMDQSSVIWIGFWSPNTPLVVPEVTYKRLAHITSPWQSMVSVKNWNFLSLGTILALFKGIKTFLIWRKCSSGVLENISVSSKKINASCNITSAKKSSMDLGMIS